MTITTNRSTSTSVAAEVPRRRFHGRLPAAQRGVEADGRSQEQGYVPVLQRVLVECDRAGARITAFDFDTAVTVAR